MWQQARTNCKLKGITYSRLLLFLYLTQNAPDRTHLPRLHSTATSSSKLGRFGHLWRAPTSPTPLSNQHQRQRLLFATNTNFTNLCLPPTPNCGESWANRGESWPQHDRGRSWTNRGGSWPQQLRNVWITGSHTFLYAFKGLCKPKCQSTVCIGPNFALASVAEMEQIIPAKGLSNHCTIRISRHASALHPNVIRFDVAQNESTPLVGRTTLHIATANLHLWFQFHHLCCDPMQK